MTNELECELSEDDQLRLHAAYLNYMAGSYDHAVSVFRDMALMGSKLSQLYLGWAYYEGHGLPQNYVEAEKCFLLASTGGLDLADYYLGRLYIKTNKYDLAANVFSSSSEKGYLPSIYNLGKLYWEGRGVDEDIIKARVLLEKAASLGHVYARRDLGLMFIKGGSRFAEICRGGYLYLTGIMSLIWLSVSNVTDDRLRG